MGMCQVGRRAWQHGSMMPGLQSLLGQQHHPESCGAALMLLRTLHSTSSPKVLLQLTATSCCCIPQRQQQDNAQLLHQLLRQDGWHNCPHLIAQQVRHNSTASSSSGNVSSWWGSIAKQISAAAQSPVLDANEAVLLRNFGSAKEAIGIYAKPRPWKGQAWVALTDRMDSFWNRLHAWWVCMRSISRFSRRSLLEEACSAYQPISQAIASRDPVKIDAIKHLLTLTVHQQLRANAEQAGKLPIQVHWQLKDIVQAEVVDGAVERLIPASILAKRRSNLHVAQFTVRFLTRQQYWTTDAQGGVLAGDPSMPQLVEEYWVFERPFYKSLFIRKAAPTGARWKLVEQLNYEAVVNPSAEVRDATAKEGTRRSLMAVGWLGFPLVALWAVRIALQSLFEAR